MWAESNKLIIMAEPLTEVESSGDTVESKWDIVKKLVRVVDYL